MDKLFYKLVVTYDGSRYYGFQKQKDSSLITIEAELEKAISNLFKENIKVIASGRTDKFTHAIGQVISFETNINIPNDNVIRAVNKNLNEDIRILSCEKYKTFHARYDVISKEYRYYISLDEYNVFKSNYLIFKENLNIEKINLALNSLVGTHDFRGFTKLDKPKNTVRTIFTAKLVKKKNLLEFRFVADGFLKYMVRSIMGTIILIGENKKEPEIIKEILETKQRKLCGKTASAKGLYLYKVNYKSSLKKYKI